MQSKLWRCLAILLVASGLAGCAGAANDQEADTAFRQMAGPILTQQLLLHTDKTKYAHDDEVHMWIENKTGTTLYFPDQSFGVQAFRYSASNKQWEPYDLGFKVGNPYKKRVEPDAWLAEEVAYSFPTRFMKIEGTKRIKIRLLVTGYSEPLETGGGQRHGAYTDIEISAR